MFVGAWSIYQRARVLVYKSKHIIISVFGGGRRAPCVQIIYHCAPRHPEYLVPDGERPAAPQASSAPQPGGAHPRPAECYRCSVTFAVCSRRRGADRPRYVLPVSLSDDLWEPQSRVTTSGTLPVTRALHTAHAPGPLSRCRASVRSHVFTVTYRLAGLARRTPGERWPGRGPPGCTTRVMSMERKNTERTETHRVSRGQ